jgi:hypothetical protein
MYLWNINLIRYLWYTNLIRYLWNSNFIIYLWSTVLILFSWHYHSLFAKGRAAGANVIKLFYLSTTKGQNKLECLSLASLFSLAWYLQVRQGAILSGKCLKGTSLEQVPAFSTNVRLGWKSIPGKTHQLICPFHQFQRKKVLQFRHQVVLFQQILLYDLFWGACTIKLFTAVIAVVSW